MRTTTTSQPAESGLVILDKPAGLTSHQVVGRVRRLLSTRKVGHAGTLDPMATGVLVLGVNRATRLLGLLALDDKAYAATIRLGVTTRTDDAEGEVLAAVGAADLDQDRVNAAVAALTGELTQVPSAVSAIKVDGVRAYARVRAGHEVTLSPRAVRVNRFEIGERREAKVDDVEVVDLDVVVECSTGTYIRALARDLGAALGTGGHLAALRRLRAGPFTVAEAQTLTEDPPRMLGLADAARRCFPSLTVDDATSAAVRHGRRLPEITLPAPRTALFAGSGEFLALYRQQLSEAVPDAVFV
jgi:tRNA pseudouridine55 synthase